MPMIADDLNINPATADKMVFTVKVLLSVVAGVAAGSWYESFMPTAQKWQLDA